MRYRRGLFVLVLSAMSLLMTGCWDQHPVETRAAVAEIGIDPGSGPGSYRYTFTFPNVTTSVGSLASTPASQEFYSIQVSAPNLLQALQAARRRESRSLYLGQVRILCLSTHLSPATWRSTLNTMADSGRFVLTTWLVAAPNANQVVSLSPPVEVVPEVGLYNAMVCRCQAIRWPGRTWQIWSDMVTSGVSPAVVDVQRQGSEFRLSHLEVLGDQALSAWNAQPTDGWAYLTGRMVKDTLTVPVDGQPIVVGLIRGHSRLHFTIHGDHIGVSDALSYSGVLFGVPADHDTLELNNAVQRRVEHTILELTQSAWAKALQSHTDPMGWHRDARWVNDNIPEGPISWQHWSLHTTVHFKLREEGVLR